MEQLLRIQTQPLQYELNIQHAQLKWTPKQSSLEISRKPGGLSMNNQPARLLIDSSQARNSVVPSPALAMRQIAAKGVADANNFIQRTAEEAKMLVKATPSQDILKSIIEDRASYPTGEFNLAFIPTSGPDFQVQEGRLDTEYQQDRLVFDVRVNRGQMEYIPGKVEFHITQWPDVMIEYIGKPMYIPPRDDAFSARA